jgi:hypothetical protein
MSTRSLMVVMALVGLAGCGYPATQMEPVAPTQSQMESATPTHAGKAKAKAKELAPDAMRSGAVSARVGAVAATPFVLRRDELRSPSG